MPYGLEMTARAKRDLNTLPEKVATTVLNFVTGPLLDNRNEWEDRSQVAWRERGMPES